MQPRYPYIQIKFTEPLDISVPEFIQHLGKLQFNYKKQSFEYIVDELSPEKEHVFIFGGLTPKGFTKITTQWQPKELAVLLSYLPNPLKNKILNTLKNTPLEIPKLSEKNLSLQRIALEKQRQIKLELTQLKGSLKNVSPVDFKPSETFTVLQQEYGVTHAEAKYPILGTFGAGPCIILALYDKSKHVALLAHIDDSVDLTTLATLFKYVTPRETVAHLVGGNFYSRKKCYYLYEKVKEANIIISNANLILTGDYPGASFAIDARTGKIYSPVSVDELNKIPHQKLRMQFQFTDMPLIKAYNSLEENDTNIKIDEDGRVIKKPKSVLTASSIFKLNTVPTCKVEKSNILQSSLKYE